MKKQIFIFFTLALLMTMNVLSSESAKEYNYNSPKAVDKVLQEIASQNKTATLHNLAKTPGNRNFQMIELGENKNLPAIMVIANMEGNYPMATEAALSLVNHLVDDWSDLLKSNRFYIFPCGNPDGYASFFSKPLYANFRNDKSFNDDKDDASNEDGPEDLNKDGFITKMRQVHPEGKWVEVSSNPLLLRKADNAKGEKGMYRLFTEGIDNDGDGKINEDGRGGVNPGHNFPHDFQHHTKSDGLWAASEAESRAILEFAFDHPEIAMIISFSRTNTLKEVPQSSRKSESAFDKYKVPERWANRMGLDKDKEYPIKDLLELARDYTGYKELSEDMLLQWLGVGAAVNPDKGDLTYWDEISEKYNKFIEDAELKDKRLDPPSFPSGSVEEWAYYQFGVPTFSLDFWTLPEPEKEEKNTDSTFISLDSLKNMTSEQFIELGEEKIAKFLIDHEAPKMYTAAMVIRGLKGGRMDTKEMAKFIGKSKKDDDEGGPDKKDEALFAIKPGSFLQWTAYDHPTLGKVEIGGQIPFANLTPPDDQVETLIEKQLPFIKELVGMLPEIKIEKVEVKQTGSDIWKLDVWIGNNGFLPYPTHQGKRCQRPSPVIVTLSGDGMTLLEGKKQETIRLLDGTSGVQKFSWLIQAPKGNKVILETSTLSAGKDKQSITLNEGGAK